MKQSYDVVLKVSYRGSYANSNYEHSSFGTSSQDLSGKNYTLVGNVSLDPLTELGYVYHDFDNQQGVNQLRAVEDQFSEELRAEISQVVTDAFFELEQKVKELEKQYKHKANEYLVENFKPSKFPNFKKLETA
jgi:hypothetical protein